MNPWQLVQQIKHILASQTWDSGDPVFGPRSVYVYAGSSPDDAEIPVAFPFALVTLDTAEPDSEDPDLLTQQMSIIIAAEAAGDALGENAVIGSSRAAVGSAGSGVAEVAERVRDAVQSLTGADGARIQVSASGTGSPGTLGRGRHIAVDTLTLSALCTSAPVYDPPQNLRHSGGDFTWTGSHIAPRWDFVRFKLGVVAGAAPGPISAATVIYSGTETTFTAAASSGNTYMVWAEYDPRGSGVIAATSSPAEVGAHLVVP